MNSLRAFLVISKHHCFMFLPALFGLGAYLFLNVTIQEKAKTQTNTSSPSLDSYLDEIYYLMDHDSNLDIVLDHAGISSFNYHQGTAVETAIQLRKQRDEYVLVQYYHGMRRDLKFRIDEEFPEETIHYNTYVSVFNKDGNRLFHIQRCDPEHPHKDIIPTINTTRTFTDEGVRVEIAVKTFKTVLHYEAR